MVDLKKTMENRICLDYYQGGCNYSGYHCSFHRSVVCCDRTVFCIKCKHWCDSIFKLRIFKYFSYFFFKTIGPSLATAITLCTTNTMETIDVNLIEKSLAKLYITPQTRIWDLVPGIDVLYDEILTVYVPTIFNQEINIFKLSIFEITSKFFVRIENIFIKYPDLKFSTFFPKKTYRLSFGRILNIVESLISLISIYVLKYFSII